MATYKLTYFDLRGRGELIRYIFHYAGISFQDERVPSLVCDEWMQMKPTTPFGHLPILEINESCVLAGSTTISRFLGEKYGLAGDNEVENAKLFGIVDEVASIISQQCHEILEPDPTLKARYRKELIESYLPYELGRLQENINEHGYVLGRKVTYGDFAVHLLTEMINRVYPEVEVMEEYPKLAQNYKKVAEIPSIAKWMKARPETVL